MRFFIAFVVVPILCATEPNLPHLAPTKWAGKLNPLAGKSSAPAAGAKLYQRECAGCHGRDATGIGKAPSLRQPAVSQAPPGALFWVIDNGAIYHGMPSFAHLPEPQRWQIVAFLQELQSR